jgi:hypothetical protein
MREKLDTDGHRAIVHRGPVTARQGDYPMLLYLSWSMLHSLVTHKEAGERRASAQLNRFFLLIWCLVSGLSVS